MSTPQAERVTKFLDNNPDLQGHCLAYYNPNEPGNLWWSRINDGWWEKDSFWMDAEAVMEWHEQECQRREKEAVRRFAEKVKNYMAEYDLTEALTSQNPGRVCVDVMDYCDDLIEIDRLAGEEE